MNNLDISFILPELVVESIIRDGLQNVKADPTIIQNVFSSLTRAYATQKYGTAELDKINALVQKDIPVIFSYHDVDSKSPCFSIMVGTDNEDKNRAHLDDEYEQDTEIITDPVKLAALIKISSLTPTAYDPISGKVSVSDLVDLSGLYFGLIFTDHLGTDHNITGGIDNTLGQKAFFVPKLDGVDIFGPGLVKSSLDYTVTEIRGVTSDDQLVIGVHAKDPLTTKYLYILLKYFLLSRKKDIIKRGLYCLTYQGSDFNRDSEFVGDRVFTRFLTFLCKHDDTWNSEQVQLIDQVIIDAIPVED